jgi:hypothetical protein
VRCGYWPLSFSLGVWRLRLHFPRLQPLSFPYCQILILVQLPCWCSDLLTDLQSSTLTRRVPRAHAMTIVLLPSRVLALRLFSRGPSTPALFSSLRVRHDQNAGHATSSSPPNSGIIQSGLGRSQNYATDVPVARPGRPKAHTGRATASRKKAAAATSDATSATTKRTATKKPAVKKKPAKPKRKTKAKAKAKPKAKRKTRVLTEQQKANKEKKAAALKQRNLRIAALLTPPSATPPKRLPSTAYMVIHQENQVKGTSPADNAKANAEKYKALSPEEREVR